MIYFPKDAKYMNLIWWIGINLYVEVMKSWSIDNVIFDISPKTIYNFIDLPNQGIKIRISVTLADVQECLKAHEHFKSYLGGNDFNFLFPYRSKLIWFFEVFIYSNYYLNDNEYYLFHLHMVDHFKEEGKKFYAFNFYNWISRNFTKIMAKVKNGVRYDPFHPIIIYIFFIDTFIVRT